ncbi:hypothetical protein A2W24_02485 [Microgenomates group bacterium RBG_16_45_19]|nr:MAG: hypothetical protein A2W24_02485 [Microgenomates group bacterium RBG_16_45_19]
MKLPIQQEPNSSQVAAPVRPDIKGLNGRHPINWEEINKWGDQITGREGRPEVITEVNNKVNACLAQPSQVDLEAIKRRARDIALGRG